MVQITVAVMPAREESDEDCDTKDVEGERQQLQQHMHEI
jgi:hypothetical protein